MKPSCIGSSTPSVSSPSTVRTSWPAGHGGQHRAGLHRLEELGLGDEPEPAGELTRDQILAEVASGALTPAEAQTLLANLA